MLQAAQQCGHPLASLLREPTIERHPGGVVLRGRGVEEVEGVIEVGRAVALDVHHADVARWALAWPASIPTLRRSSPRPQCTMQARKMHACRCCCMAARLRGSRARSREIGLRRREQQLTAYGTAGMPRGFRHEFASLDFEEIADELTRHLVATHHGYGRPWLVPCADAAAAGAGYVRLDRHWADDWAALIARHGPWALAQAEWLLRCADARASIEEAGPIPLEEARDAQA